MGSGICRYKTARFLRVLHCKVAVKMQWKKCGEFKDTLSLTKGCKNRQGISYPFLSVCPNSLTLCYTEAKLSCVWASQWATLCKMSLLAEASNQFSVSGVKLAFYNGAFTLMWCPCLSWAFAVEANSTSAAQNLWVSKNTPGLAND